MRSELCNCFSIKARIKVDRPTQKGYEPRSKSSRATVSFGSFTGICSIHSPTGSLRLSLIDYPLDSFNGGDALFARDVVVLFVVLDMVVDFASRTANRKVGVPILFLRESASDSEELRESYDCLSVLEWNAVNPVALIERRSDSNSALTALKSIAGPEKRSVHFNLDHVTPPRFIVAVATQTQRLRAGLSAHRMSSKITCSSNYFASIIRSTSCKADSCKLATVGANLTPAAAPAAAHAAALAASPAAAPAAAPAAVHAAALAAAPAAAHAAAHAASPAAAHAAAHAAAPAAAPAASPAASLAAALAASPAASL